MGELQRVSGVGEAPESTFELSQAGGPSVDDVQLDPVTVHGWRASDRRLPPRDPFRLLAFIEWRDDVFEVMQLGAGFEWHQFETIEDAVAHVVATSMRVAQQRLHGELDWLR